MLQSGVVVGRDACELHTQRSGHIVNVSSVLGLTAVPGWALYCAGKFALEGLTEALAGEVAESGIDVTLVEPGYFRTSFLTEDSLTPPSGVLDAYATAKVEVLRDTLEQARVSAGATDFTTV
ncbi:SDR family NAD(P)-dependent oxidoreductase [Cellulomonas timonensis]|uniref:SDR family NAD(P)-dependent oxidoreductase n=1 Tax=Cellulomonas timonensis TaxID=1689271 RepID=UPI000A630837|nr:SDR family NAD(P)-dependent oxidoreductase [Cellulomonas timonensis]